MDAIVPAAGKGTRLRPVTDEKPKGLVEVAGEPILTHCFEDLAALDVSKIVVVVGYRGDQIVEYYGDSFEGITLEYVTQENQKGIGHALDLAADSVGDEFVMVLGDNVFERPPRNAVETYRETDAELAFPVEEVYPEEAGKYAVCEVTDDGEILDVREKPDDPPSNLVMTGFLVADEGFLDVCGNLSPSDRGEYELGDAVREFVADRPGKVVPLEGRRRNVNTQADVERAAELVD